MNFYQRVREYMEKPVKTVSIPVTAMAIFASLSFLPNNLFDGKLLPSEFGGLPDPFMTRLVDDDGDGIPDRALMYSIGPGFFNGQERKPMQREIDWYRSQE